jgi:hypothetical protein
VLEKDRNALGLAALEKVIKFGVNNKIALMNFKSDIEVFIGFVSTFSWAFGFCAPLFSILFT